VHQRTGRPGDRIILQSNDEVDVLEKGERLRTKGKKVLGHQEKREKRGERKIPNARILRREEHGVCELILSSREEKLLTLKSKGGDSKTRPQNAQRNEVESIFRLNYLSSETTKKGGGR